MKSANCKSLARTLGCCLIALALTACTIGRVNKRVSYWTKETNAHVFVGTPIEDAQAYLASRGLEMHCCTSGFDNEPAITGTERDVGRFFFTEYSVFIVVDMTPDRRVSGVQVFRVGLGL